MALEKTTREGTTWHAIDRDATLARAKTTDDGLDTAEAKRRLAEFGPNVLRRASKDGPLQLLWRQINNPLIWVLIGSSVLATAMGKITDGLVVLAVVVLNTIIGFLQEYRASQAIEALMGMVPENATVMRDGKKVVVPVAELVPGDVVMLASGDKVPADMRLIHVKNLQIEEAALTGESVPTQKSIDSVAEDALLGDRTSMTYSGTLVTYGTGTAVVVSTGSDTELGRISTLLHEAANLETPLTKALQQIAKIITIAILAVSILMVAVGVFRALGEGLDLGTALRETISVPGPALATSMSNGWRDAPR